MTWPNAEQLIKRSERMKQARSNHDIVNNKIRDLMYPTTGAFDRPEVKGRLGRQEVYDNTGEQAGKNLAAALHGFLTGPTGKLFDLVPRAAALENSHDVRVYLDDVVKKIHRVLQQPEHRFGVNQNLKYLDLVYFGGGAMFIDERPGFGPMYLSRPIQELWIAENSDGEVDTVLRESRMTARQAVQAFQGDVGEKVRKAFVDPKKSEDEFTFLHLTEPNTDRIDGRLDNRNKPFRSIHVCVEDKKTVRRSGYPEFPWTVPRWEKRAGEVYPRGPGHAALPDVAMLQRMDKATVRGTEKTVDPALLVADDGIMSPVRTRSSGMTFVRYDLMTGQGSPVRALQTNARPDVGEQMMAPRRERIDNAFFAHLLRVTQDPRMTATQVLEIAERTDTVLGPNLSRLESEDLEKIVTRTFAILERAGAFMPAPDELKDGGLDIVFLSPLARAHRLTEMRAYVQALEMRNAFVAGGGDRVRHVLDDEKAYRDVLDILGVPAASIVSADRVAELADAETAALEQQNALAAAGEVAGIAGAAAPAVEAMAAGGGSPAGAGSDTGVGAAA